MLESRHGAQNSAQKITQNNFQSDIVDSTKLKQSFGDREAVIVIQHHHAVIREILGHFSDGEEIETAGDSFFIVFTKPSDAVKF